MYKLSFVIKRDEESLINEANYLVYIELLLVANIVYKLLNLLLKYKKLGRNEQAVINFCLIND